MTGGIGATKKKNGFNINFHFMTKDKHIKIYPADQYGKVRLWFRRKFRGHLVVEGKQLKHLLPKGSVNKRVIKNKALYGVTIKTKKHGK